MSGRHENFVDRNYRFERAGTAKGFAFLSLEDETVIVIVIVIRIYLHNVNKFALQNPTSYHWKCANTWNVLTVRATDIEALAYRQRTVGSHNSH